MGLQAHAPSVKTPSASVFSSLSHILISAWLLVGSNASKMTSMTPPLSARRRSKTPPPGETGQEALYLRSLSDRQVTVSVKLSGGETVRGWIEYFDDGMLRLTREGKPNLFIYKQQIRSITEVGRGQRRVQRSETRDGAAQEKAVS
jgi:host factor-I protein